MDRISYGEAHLYQSELIQCQSYRVNYACSYGGVAMSGVDGIYFSTQVPAIRCVWVPVAMSYCAKH
jgi:hypothetical protein